MFFKRLLCLILGHIEIEQENKDLFGLSSDGTVTYINSMSFYFKDKRNVLYIKEFKPCKRCIMYEKLYKKNDLTRDEEIIKDIIE